MREDQTVPSPSGRVISLVARPAVKGPEMSFEDRKRLFRIDDGNGDALFVPAKTFAEAVAKFKKWNCDEDESSYESIAYVGELIDETKTRE